MIAAQVINIGSIIRWAVASAEKTSLMNDVLLEDKDDGDVIRRILGGDVDLFEQLIERYKQHVFAIVKNHVPSNRVEEVAHEVFVQAFKSLATYSAKSPFEHWLSRIAVRRCCDFWRENKRSREIPISVLSDNHQDWIEGVLSASSHDEFESQSNKKEAGELVDWALEQLSAEDRTVLTMVHLEGHSVKDVAAQLGWSVAKVKVRALRSRYTLRKIIGNILEKKQ